MKHYILTRFNAGLYSSDLHHDDWMRRRMELAERFWAASLRSQTCKDFTLLVAVDLKTPLKYEAAIKKLVARIRCEFGYVVNNRMMIQRVQETAPPGERIITTRLDNDDAVSRDFVEQIQDAAGQCDGTPEAINFDRGYIVDIRRHATIGTLHLDTQRSNPFISLVEQAEDGQELQTVLCCKHGDIAKRFPTARPQTPGWMQVIHGSNKLNSIVRGRKVQASSITNFNPTITGIKQ